jgi:hypothetical protein
MWRSSSRWAIALYDRVYRLCRGLDTATSEVGPALRIEFRRACRRLRLGDGTAVGRWDVVGVLHLNNERLRRLAAGDVNRLAVGLGVRREIVASLRALAVLTAPGGRAAGAVAFTATTIHHRGLLGLGFERDPVPPPWPRVTAAYHRALRAAIHPARTPRRRRRPARERAERLWLSRRRLLALYGTPDTRLPAGPTAEGAGPMVHASGK